MFLQLEKVKKKIQKSHFNNKLPACRRWCSPKSRIKVLILLAAAQWMETHFPSLTRPPSEVCTLNQLLIQMATRPVAAWPQTSDGFQLHHIASVTCLRVSRHVNIGCLRLNTPIPFFLSFFIFSFCLPFLQ